MRGHGGGGDSAKKGPGYALSKWTVFRQKNERFSNRL